MTATVAQFDRVSREYRSGLIHPQVITALREVSLTIERGEVLGLLGPNRAGKTTLAKVLLSLCRPSAGTIQRLGHPLTDRSTLARIGYVHENHAFPRHLDAWGLLEFHGALALVPSEVVLERIPRLLEQVGLADRAREPLARFSKGMIQRLGLAQAMINDPELLVLDEPTEGLDPEARKLLRSVIQDFRQRGRSVLLISHDLPEVEQLCDRVAILVAGRLVFAGTLAELRHRGAEEVSLEQALSTLYSKTPS